MTDQLAAVVHRLWEKRVSSDLLLELRLKLTCTSPHWEGVPKSQIPQKPRKELPKSYTGV